MYFSILIYDEPDSAGLRDEYRKAHLDYLKTFDAQTLFAGPFTADDESADLGSLRLIDLADRAAAEKHIADEPFVISGVQKRWSVHPWKPGLPFSWRDCPRTEGNIQALFYGIDHPDGSATRARHRKSHLGYLAENAESFMMRGPLLNEAGTEPIGNVWLLDIPNLDAARSLVNNEPYNKAGLYQDALLKRWRFGRVFDRFKT